MRTTLIEPAANKGLNMGISEILASVDVRHIAHEDREALYKVAKEAAIQQFETCEKVTDPIEIIDMIRMRFLHETSEVFGVINLGMSGEILSIEIKRGTLDVCAIYPREIVKSALLRGAKACIVFHTKVSGSYLPTKSDNKLTSSLIKAFGGLGLHLLDHLIIGRDGFFSFAEAKNIAPK